MSPREIIAYSLPTFAEHYRQAPRSLPSRSNLLDAADRIITALREGGYVIQSVPTARHGDTAGQNR